MSRSSLARILLVASALFFGACGGRGPVEELSPLLEGLGDPTRSVLGLSAELFRVLDEDSRAALAERAKAASARAGVEISAAELIQARGIGPGRRVSRVELVEAGARDARLRLYFDAVVPTGAAVASGRGTPPAAVAAPIELDARLEEGRWRLALVDLGKLIRALELDAAREGGGG